MNKEKLLLAVSDALKSGSISRGDLLSVIEKASVKVETEEKANNRVSAVDIMFYIAGIVFFAAIAALISQSWDSGIGTRVFLSAGLGAIFWSIAIYLIQLAKKDDIRSGLTNALLLTGSLSLIYGGFIITNDIVNFDNPNFTAVAATLAVLGAMHITFGWQIRRDLLVLIGVILSVAAFPSLVFGLIQGNDLPAYVYYLTTAIGGGLLAYATRVVSWIGASSAGAARVFDSLSAFAVLMSLYLASFDDNIGLVWLLLLIAGIIGLFYLSIVLQDKLMLGNGSLFLVIAVITISFRYFSGYGVATSLFIAAIGLIGTAITATTINRRYIK